MEFKQLFAKKPLQLLLDEMRGEHRLRRVLGPVQLTSLGIGCIIGTGIFVLVGKAAHDTSGPALMLSFVVAGLACIFAALCYAEFASIAPVAGSAYTYAYATLGELFAWIIGWDLVLEYTVASATVSHGWSKYFQDFLKIFGVTLPEAIRTSPIEYKKVIETVPETGLPTAVYRFFETGSVLDLPALMIALLITAVLVKGIRESASFNAAMVITKVVIVIFVIVVGAFYINPSNWTPFAPYGWTGISFFGWTVAGQSTAGGDPLGILAGAGIIFFAYIGFDSVSTHSEEARNPQRDVPIGIIASLIICTILYIAVAAVLTGMLPYTDINIDAPVSDAFGQKGLTWARFVISLGAMTGITSVLLVLMLSQPRVLLAMARDGLLPNSFFGAVHERFRTPWKSTILTGIVVAIMGALLPLGVLADLTNIGTLLAFVIVCAAVLILRKTHPDAERPFRVPFGPVFPVLGILTCLLLMFSLPPENWVRLGVWLGIGLLIYLGYGKSRSVMANYLRLEEARHGLSPGGHMVTQPDEPAR
jgi:APA family basic amino acid/polyamine antiporter